MLKRILRDKVKENEERIVSIKQQGIGASEEDLEYKEYLLYSNDLLANVVRLFESTQKRVEGRVDNQVE